ncbi:MAG: ATP-dependent helicase [Verrucomicrobia bacterium]|nr:MAG: ATP-dependent helicase [Verrucomicrobiota bacterium]
MAREYVIRRFRSKVDLHIDYAAELNEQQLVAVQSEPGPALVLAGAGAGKTRTLTYRVAFLLEQGIAPEHILLLTFTNKAAREMMERVRQLIGRELPDLWGGTFHAIGNRILRRHAERIGYQPGFTILDREDAKDLLNACLGESDIDTKATRFPKPAVLCEIFSLAANMDRAVGAVLATHYPWFAHLEEPITRLAELYQQRKRAAQVMDFDDLQTQWLRLLKEDAELRERYQRRFQFILVDEYQDTNQIQGELVDLLAGRHHNVMAVGDDSQSIYSWRGANFRNILTFPERHPGTQIFRIETNYRSTPEILEVANAAIAANRHQHPKKLVPARPSGMKPALVSCHDAHEQAAFVAQRVLELRDEGIPLEEMAVLYRSHFHALELQMELTQRNIPFSITSGLRFFEQAHIKDMAAFLRLLFNPADETAFKRMVLMLPGIGPKGAARLWQEFRSALGKGSGTPTPADVAPRLQALEPSVPKKAKPIWAQLNATLAQVAAPEVWRNPPQVIELLLDGIYDELLKAQYADAGNRRDDLDRLAAFAGEYGSIEELLGQLALLTNVEAETAAPRTDDEERLRLSTVHQAKGLEFRVVFVIMLCDGMFPSHRSVEQEEALEEERRLFYVAITRAKDELYLCWPLLRPMGGGDYMQQPSRFLGEIPPELLENWNLVSESGVAGPWS